MSKAAGQVKSWSGSEVASPALPVAFNRLKSLAYCWIAVTAIFCVYNFAQHATHGLTDGALHPLGADFINTWSGSHFVWKGEARTVYDWYAYHDFQERLVGGKLDMYNYSYPPTLLVLSAPFGLLPYLPAFAIWTIGVWLAFYVALREALPKGALLLALATPAVFINVLAGQNGALTAALLGGGLCLLKRNPVAAGVLFGLLIYKPHLGVLLPIALFAGHEWRAFVAAAITAGAVLLLSVAFFGIDIWLDYLRNADVIRRMALDDGEGIHHRMLSVFVFARRTLGLDPAASYLLQTVAALPVIAMVGYAWFRRWSENGRNVLLVTGTFLVTPYLYDYDFVISAFIVVWLMAQSNEQLHLQRPAFVASAMILVLPFIGSLTTNFTGLSIGPIFILPAYVVAWLLGTARSRRGAWLGVRDPSS